jgi:BolA protein
MAGVRDRLEERLSEVLHPTHLEVRDESAAHAGHAGARPGGESHFRATIVSEAFEGKTLLERHRMVYDLFSEELRGSIHALALTTKTPAEWLRR